jgi:hypothetical protein
LNTMLLLATRHENIAIEKVPRRSLFRLRDIHAL